ncbi:MAG: hypothetical protein ACOY0S_03845 [Patescibacteria group bacterium]
MRRAKALSRMWWLGVIAAAAVVLWPLTRPGFFISDDGEWMIIRLSAFWQALREGQFPVRFLGRLNHEFGYPVANFLYPGFLYLGSFIHALGFSFSDSVKLIFAGSVVGAGVFLFWGLLAELGSFPSFMGALSLLLAPYLAFDLYKRGSVGEILALAVATFGMANLWHKRRILFPLVVGLLLVSHNSLALLFLALFIGYILYAHLGQFWWPLVLGLGLATFFWLPALFERRYVLFDTVTVSRPEQYFVSGNSLYLLGTVNILVWFLIWFKRRTIKQPDLWFFLVASVVSSFLATPLSQSIWSLPSFAKLFQFPYRLLAIALISNAWLTGVLFENLSSHLRPKLLVIFLVLWLVPLLPMLNQVKTVLRPEGYYTTNEATTTVADEYLPRWVTDQPRQRRPARIELIKGKGSFKVEKINTQKIDVEVEAETESIVQINKIYYPGWGVLINGQPGEIDYAAGGGLMQVAVPAGKHRLQAEFRETPLRLAADLVTLASFLVWLRFFLRDLKGYKIS